MVVRNNYNECLTNLACSIRKYFGLEYHHNTLPYIDEILERDKPKNVIVILFDGMGSRILNRTLDDDAFFIKNELKEITSVFPATTTAATTSIRTGLNPCEHGWLGWNTYIPNIDKVITLFKDYEKESKEINEDFLRIKNDVLVSKTITDEINEKGEFYSKELFPFGTYPYKDLDDMLRIILEESQKPGKKYLYGYDDDPDKSMHVLGPDHSYVQGLIKLRSEKIEELCEILEDSVLIVIADHGHIKINHFYLTDYPEIMELLERSTSIEERALSFKIKDGCHQKFMELFIKSFGDYYDLYNKQDIIDSKLFGDGIEIKLFREAIGDYIAIAKSNYAIVTPGDEILASQHAGYTDDEIYVPLIVKSLVKK